jgi:hypothetical protein
MASKRITYISFESIDTALGIDGDVYPHSDICVDSVSMMPSPAKLYWAQFTKEERRAKMAKISSLRKNPGPKGGHIVKQSTKDKIRKAHLNKEKPSLQKGGTVIKDGECVTFTCLSHFCREYSLSTGHICELLQGKRKSVKGWKLWAP